MEDYNSETESDYTSYWRDWVGGRTFLFCSWQARSIFVPPCCVCFVAGFSFYIGFASYRCGTCDLLPSIHLQQLQSLAGQWKSHWN